MKLARVLILFSIFTIAWFFPSIAHAFCGFYVSQADTKLENDATRVVLMRDGTRTVLSMQNAYKGPVASFAMVVPVPVVLQKENVKVLSNAIFDRVDDLSAPRLVEYWEQDPCAVVPEALDTAMARSGMGLSGVGSGGGGIVDLGVTIEAKFEVGEYEIVILSARDSQGLDTWLKQERYKIPDGAEPYLRPYVQAGSKFFVAKVDPAKVHFENGRAELSPLRFHYDSDQFALPVRLGLLSSSGKQDLEVFILGKERFEIANGKNVTIPTNIDVNDATRTNFSGFYTSLFDDTLEKNPGAVVTEYSWASNSCDPCPVPSLTQAELASLGADVIPSSTWGDPGVPAPKVNVTVSPISVAPPVPNVERVVAGLRPRFKRCYMQGLAQDPSQHGQVTLRTTIGPSGEVENAAATKNTGISAAVTSCLTRSIRNAQFDAPGVAATMTFNLTFAPETTAPRDAKKPARVLTRVPDFTLTRLHTRYSKDALGQDLVFRVAPAIVGGRENPGPDGTLSTTATELQVAPGSGASTFQARYAIRHRWAGALTCAEPHRGIWGGPPNGVSPPALAAQKLATAPRGGASFASFLGAPAVTPDSRAATDASTSSDVAPIVDASVLQPKEPPPVEPKAGCGCSLAGDSSATLAPMLALFAFAFACARRRRN